MELSCTCGAARQAREFRCEGSSFGDFCLRSNITGLNGALNVELTAQKNTFEGRYLCRVPTPFEKSNSSTFQAFLRCISSFSSTLQLWDITHLYTVQTVHTVY